MKCILPFALALLSGHAAAGDLVVTTSKHADANPMAKTPASDTTQVQWIGTDRMRIEDGPKVTIVRADLKKMYIIDTAAKTYSTVDLPLDLKKYLPAEYAPMMEQMAAQVKVTVTPTTETKKVKDWNATRFTMTMSLPMGGSMTQEMWATKDAGVDMATYGSLFEAFLSSNPFGGASMASEMKKVDGLPVFSERTMSMMGSEMKSRDEVTSIEQKEPAAGLYDVPAGFTEKPFDPMADSPMGGGRGGKRDHAPRGG